MTYFAAVVALYTISAPSTPPQAVSVAQFKAAFAKRRGNWPTERPDPAIQKCIAIVANELGSNRKLKLSDVSSVDAFLSPFQKAAAGSSHSELSVLDYASLAVDGAERSAYRAAAISMGNVSRLFIWVKGKQVSVPRDLRWSFPFFADPEFLDDSSLLVHERGESGAGMRYAYRVHLFRLGNGSIGRTFVFNGLWTIDEGPNWNAFERSGMTITLRTIDEPLVLGTSQSEVAFPRLLRYKIAGGLCTKILDKPDMPYARIVDRWIWRALRSKSRDELQSKLRNAWPKDFDLADGIKESRVSAVEMKVEFSYGSKTFMFRLKKPSGVWCVSSFQAKEA